MLLTSALSKENSAISTEEWVLMCKVFTTATRKLRVKLKKMTGEANDAASLSCQTAHRMRFLLCWRVRLSVRLGQLAMSM